MTSRAIRTVLACMLASAPLLSLPAQQRPTSPRPARAPRPAVVPRADSLSRVWEALAPGARDRWADAWTEAWQDAWPALRATTPMLAEREELARAAHARAWEAVEGLGLSPTWPETPLVVAQPHVALAPLAPLDPLAPLAPLDPWPLLDIAAVGDLELHVQEALHAATSAEVDAWGPHVPLREPWLQGDPGDSLYRQARELLNKGEYRRAALAFRELSDRMPTSGYAADALYWQAFALYRIGGTPELRGAVEALEQQKARYPGARLQAESATLALRIRGALAARGDAAAAALVRTAAADSALRCDREEQAIRAEALNALSQSDPDGAMPILQKTLARRDSCSVTMRRTAVFLIGAKRRDAAGVALLSSVAREDPSVDVRASALEWLARAPNDEGLATLEALTRDTVARVQQGAVRALVRHPGARARQFVRTLVERDETPERLRLEALGAFDRERTTAEDVAWMRTLFGRTDNPRLKARLVSTLSGIGGADVEQWLLALARDPEQGSDTRRYALRRVGRTVTIAELARLYDGSAERTIREALIESLAQRTEGEATDKLLDIVRNGTDPQLRSRAISALSQKKDPRTLRLLMEIIDK